MSNQWGHQAGACYCIQSIPFQLQQLPSVSSHIYMIDALFYLGHFLECQTVVDCEHTCYCTLLNRHAMQMQGTAA